MKKYLFTLILLSSFVALIAQDKDKEEKKITFALSGYVNLNTIADFNGLDDYNDFTTSEIPIDPSPYEKSYRFHMTAQQSRLIMGINYVTPWGNLMGVVSGDFAATDGNLFRLRDAYLQFDHILLGQANTTFGNPYVIPVTIDFEGPNSSTTLRNPMIKYSNKFGKGFTYTLALEMRGTDTQSFTTNMGIPIDKPFKTIPTFVPTLNKQGDWGVISLSLMIDGTRYFNLDSIEHVTVGYGGAFSAIIKTWKQNHFNVFFIAGKGVSNFIDDLSGKGYNGVPDVTTDKLVLLNSIGGFVSYTQNWTNKLSSNFVFSYIELEKTALLPDEDFRHSTYILGNLFYAPFDHLVFGVEYIWGELFVQNNKNGDANRLQFLAQFNF